MLQKLVPALFAAVFTLPLATSGPAAFAQSPKGEPSRTLCWSTVPTPTDLDGAASLIFSGATALRSQLYRSPRRRSRMTSLQRRGLYLRLAVLSFLSAIATEVLSLPKPATLPR